MANGILQYRASAIVGEWLTLFEAPDRGRFARHAEWLPAANSGDAEIGPFLGPFPCQRQSELLWRPFPQP